MSGKNNISARGLAFLVLQDVFADAAYANIALSKRLNDASLSPIDRRFATELVYGTIKACGTLANAKAKGLLRSEGKEYIMHDGDVVNFLFNV